MFKVTIALTKRDQFRFEAFSLELLAVPAVLRRGTIASLTCDETSLASGVFWITPSPFPLW